MFTKWAAGKIQAVLDGQCSAIKITTFISGRSDQICSSSVILVLYELQFVIGSTKMLDYSLCVVSFFISLFNPLHSLLWWKTGNGLQLQLSCNFNIKGAQITYSHWWTWMQNAYFVLYKLNISGVVPNHRCLALTGNDVFFLPLLLELLFKQQIAKRWWEAIPINLLQ